MNIGFIGAGKVGCSLGKYMTEKGLTVVGYYSQHIISAQWAAVFTKSAYFSSLSDIVNACDLLVLTVPDDSIIDVWDLMQHVPIKNKYICHCSGSMPSTAFFNAHLYGAYTYSIHPLYAMSDKATSWQGLNNAFFTVEGDVSQKHAIDQLLQTLGNPYQWIDRVDKSLYHAAATIGSNLVNSLYYLSTQLLEACHFSPETAQQALHQLFIDNAQRIAEYGPIEAMTGPVERNDSKTILSHIEALRQYDQQLHLLSKDCMEKRDSNDVSQNTLKTAHAYDSLYMYQSLSKVLIAIAEKKHITRDYSQLRSILDETHSTNITTTKERG